MSEVIFDIEVENLDSPFEREKIEGLPKAILVELLIRRIKATGKAIEYIEKQNPLSVSETKQKEQLKLAYKNSDIFKTLCHLENFEIALWEVEEILKRG